ncbi:hypothetical protein BJ986_001320 [Phycicoccus badiiscoriae]|uniref:DinB-like domain-containing protein n=1 Tax=Pedococcus badiiscoriae TaxID=642776 RepID=A0A852WCH5_9MICO|nr:DinB family protein [Pedococcus badiiscoriae]NYG06833.1 hypothetical protein [Pedococcus badiiscoriae]
MGDLPAGASDRIVPDTKDWTWTLSRPCPECGFDAASVARADIARLALASTAAWPVVLERPAATQRPSPTVWSPLEYACHVRDVCRVFKGRVELMLDQDGPQFANWDQDETAVAERYGEQDPAVVGAEVQEAAAAVAAAFAAVPDDAWDRTGLRSDGSEFTVQTLGQYFLHDLAHHLVDVGA